MRKKLAIVITLPVIAVMTFGVPLLTWSGPPSGNVSLADPERARDQTDQSVRSRIEERLRRDDRIAWELLHVEVHQGHTTLYGEVRTPQEKGLAALLASTVPGVTGLTNSILVEPATGPDHELASAIWKALRTVPALDGNETLRVRVKNAVAKLEGMVEQSTQKQAAEKAAASVHGVTTVINLIEVHANSSPGDSTRIGKEKLKHEGVQLQP